VDHLSDTDRGVPRTMGRSPPPATARAHRQRAIPEMGHDRPRRRTHPTAQRTPTRQRTRTRARTRTQHRPLRGRTLILGTPNRCYARDKGGYGRTIEAFRLVYGPTSVNTPTARCHHVSRPHRTVRARRQHRRCRRVMGAKHHRRHDTSPPLRPPADLADRFKWTVSCTVPALRLRSCR
jgi:hypothetical protein